MTEEKAFIFTIEDPEDNQNSRTLVLQRYIDSELTPKFEIAALSGEYKTRTQFYEAFKNSELRFDLITFYGADFSRFIEKCKSLEE